MVASENRHSSRNSFNRTEHIKVCEVWHISAHRLFFWLKDLCDQNVSSFNHWSICWSNWSKVLIYHKAFPLRKQKSKVTNLCIFTCFKTSPPWLSEWLVQKVQQQQWLVARDIGKPDCLDKICSKDRSDKDQNQTLPDNGKAMTRQYQTCRHWQATRQLPGSCKGQETPCSVSSQPTRRRPPSPESSSPEQVFPSSTSNHPCWLGLILTTKQFFDDSSVLVTNGHLRQLRINHWCLKVYLQQ